MAQRKKHTPEQVVNLLRQIEVDVANGKTTSQSCKEAEITEQTCYRWRKGYGGLQVNQARRLKELESENAKLRDEFLNGEMFYSIQEMRVLAERWRIHYNTIRPHSSLSYCPPTP